MKLTTKFIAVCALLVGATSTFAGGSHAGGHGTAAIGEPGKPGRVNRTIEVEMTDAKRKQTKKTDN